jgi:hypothetical protein
MRISISILVVLFNFISLFGLSQTFGYSGYIYNSAGVGISNVPVKVYKRTTPILTGFTSQTNYNGHSYYRSSTGMFWQDAKIACENMGGHLATISNAAENNFLFTTWPSGWIGYYQDNTGAFYSEPNGGWRWTQPYYSTGQYANYEVSLYTSGSTLNDIKSGINSTLYNSPAYTSGGGKYLSFNGINQYGITGNLSSGFGNSEVVTLMMWIYPIGNGVMLSELGTGNSSSGWHESVFEITGGNTLRIGLWNGSGITQVNTPITLNTWNLIGLTYDGSTMTGYKNGVSIGSVTFNREAAHLNGNGEYFAFGLSDITNMGSGAYGNYRLGSFQVYTTSLTSDQMNINYMSTAWRFGIYPYSAWNGGEPNNSGSEDYIQFVGGGLWNDLPNNVSLPYVLEFDNIVTYSPWVLETTVYTNSNGQYTISVPTNPSIERYIEISSLSIPTPSISDAQSPLSTILGMSSINSKKYYLYDVNNDSKVNIADSYYIHGVVSGRFNNWVNPLPRYRIFNTNEYNIINSNSGDIRGSYPGTQSVLINSPVNGGSTNFYVFRTGFSQ